jgi:hypothetical protein
MGANQKVSPRPPRRAKAPLPPSLPGEFFVVLYDRDAETYTIVVDDETNSSYNLGVGVEPAMRYFRFLDRIMHTTPNPPQADLVVTGYRAIDIAREFGAAAASLTERDRVTPVKEQPTPQGFKWSGSNPVYAHLPRR